MIESPLIILISGLPGAGKSAFAWQFVAASNEQNTRAVTDESNKEL